MQIFAVLLIARKKTLLISRTRFIIFRRFLLLPTAEIKWCAVCTGVKITVMTKCKVFLYVTLKSFQTVFRKCTSVLKNIKLLWSVIKGLNTSTSSTSSNTQRRAHTGIQQQNRLWYKITLTAAATLQFYRDFLIRSLCSTRAFCVCGFSNQLHTEKICFFSCVSKHRKRE